MKNLKAILTIGISASGKSFWARDQVSKDPINWVELNRDNIRFNFGPKDWTKYKFTRANEQKVTDRINDGISKASELGLNLIISDTNLNEKFRDELVARLKADGYKVEFKVFDISLEEAWKRDAQREGGVGQAVIYRQYQQYLAYKERRTYEPSTAKTNAVICDIDGTVASMEGIRKPFDWDKVSLDLPRTSIIEMVQGYKNCGYEIIFLSGRDGQCYEDTFAWINNNIFPDTSDWSLYMREAGDNRKDFIIKEELFWNHVADCYNVRVAIDDRPCMIRLWHELKIPNVIAVADPWVEF